jgi:hypothetical protein
MDEQRIFPHIVDHSIITDLRGNTQYHDRITLSEGK